MRAHLSLPTGLLGINLHCKRILGHSEELNSVNVAALMAECSFVFNELKLAVMSLCSKVRLQVSKI